MGELRDLERCLSIMEPGNWYSLEDPSIQRDLSFFPKSFRKVFLSEEARYVIKLVTEIPGELLDASVGGYPVVSKRGKITKYRLRKFLRQKNWKWHQIQKTFDELKEYTKGF